MPGQIKLITVDFSHRLQQLRPNLGTHFNGTCQLLATKSYQNTLPLIYFAGRFISLIRAIDKRDFNGPHTYICMYVCSSLF